MLKNIIKLSGLFSAIFVIFLIIFLKTTDVGAVTTYSCTCTTEAEIVQSPDFNFLEDFETKTYNRTTESTLSTDQVKTACEKVCVESVPGNKMDLSAYQKAGEPIKYIDPQKTPQAEQPAQPETSKEFVCKCLDANNSIYSVPTEEDCSFKCLGAGYEIEKRTSVENVCHCPNGLDQSKAEGTTCDIVCKDQQTTSDQTQTPTGTQPTGTSQTTATGCECTNGFKDSSVTDSAGCTAICEGNGGVKSFTPPQGGQQTTGISIENPIGVKTPAELIQRIINYVLGFVGAIAVLIIIYSGFVYMTSRGNEKQIESAKNSLTYAIIGLVVIFASIIIVNAVISAIGG